MRAFLLAFCVCIFVLCATHIKYMQNNLGQLELTIQKQTSNTTIEIAKSFQGLNVYKVNERINKLLGKQFKLPLNSWCAGFVNLVLKLRGYPTTNSLLARSFLKWGKATTSPKEGDIVVFRDMTRARNPEKGHVSFFVREQGNKVYVLGGNQDDVVKIKAYPINCVIGFRTI